MKTKLLIIEDNFYKFFTTKQVLESQLNIKVKVIDAPDGRQMMEAAQGLSPDLIMFRPCGVVELLSQMKKRRTNRRNTEITLLVTQEVDDELARRLQAFAAAFPKRVVADAA